MARADLDKQPSDVRRMFDTVAKRYDVTNDVLSLGQDRRWRHEVIDAVAPVPGERILDLAAGTGTSSEPFHDRGATVVPCDFSLGMLRVGKQSWLAELGSPTRFSSTLKSTQSPELGTSAKHTVSAFFDTTAKVNQSWLDPVKSVSPQSKQRV